MVRYTRGKSLDVSASGLRIEAGDSVPLHQLVTVNMEELKVTGSARVRHVHRKGFKYILGLDLSETLGARALEALHPQGELAASR